MPRPITVLVTGATGLQGGAVARSLLERGHRVRALTRRPTSQAAATLHVLGADVYEGDFDDASSVKRAARGADALFLMSTPFEDSVAAEVRHAMCTTRAAAEAGVERMVYSSIAGADRVGGAAYFESKREIEGTIRGRAKAWTIVAPTFLMDNLQGRALLAGLRDGELRLPLPPTRPLQMVSVQNLAEVVRLALERPSELAGKRLELASDRLAGPEMASTLTEVTGREIVHVEAHPGAGGGEGIAVLWAWLGRAGHDVDPEPVRRAYPEVEWNSLARWARGRDWSALGPTDEQRSAT